MAEKRAPKGKTKPATESKPVAKIEVRILADGILLGDSKNLASLKAVEVGDVVKVTPATAEALTSRDEAEYTN